MVATCDNSTGTGAAYFNLFTSALAYPPESATLLVECELDGGAMLSVSGRTTKMPQLVPVVDGSADLMISESGTYRVPMRLVDAANEFSTRSFAYARAGTSCTARVRLSLYEGDYEGAYVPYVP